MVILTTSLAISLFTINSTYSTANAMMKMKSEESNTRIIGNKFGDLNNILLENEAGAIVALGNTSATLNKSINDKNEEAIDTTSTNPDVAIETTAYEEPATTEVEASAEAVSNNEATYKATYTMEATAYTGGEFTFTGTTPVHDPSGLSTIAVDPSVIPLGSKVYIPGYGEAIAADTGGAINGNIIDLYMNSYDECIQWGRQNVTLYILAYPGEW